MALFLLRGFHFFVVLVVGSFDFLHSHIRLGLSLHLSDLEQIQEEGRRWFRENGTRSWPSSRLKWSSISAFARSVNDCEIPLPLSFLINNGGSGFGYFVGVGLLTDRWVWY